MILFGGVQASNSTAIGYYKKVGFTETGRFENEHRMKCIDMVRAIPQASRDTSVR